MYHSDVKARRSTELLFSDYPRTRPPLTEAHAKVYAEQYRINRDGETLADGAAQKLEQWMHRRIARLSGGPLLELGGGTLNHLRFENDAEPYDVVEPFTALFEGRPEARKVRAFFDGAEQIPDSNSYRRIISVAVLEHLPDLPADVAKCALLLDEDGVFQAGIPSEGGFLWWLGWRFSTGLAYYLRTGLDYGVVMRHEHVNDAREILAVVKHFFDHVQVTRFPTPFHELSFYAYLEARGPRRDRAREFLEARAGAAH
jgi:SAM-dependent methyltransferase